MGTAGPALATRPATAQRVVLAALVETTAMAALAALAAMVPFLVQVSRSWLARVELVALAAPWAALAVREEVQL